MSTTCLHIITLWHCRTIELGFWLALPSPTYALALYKFESVGNYDNAIFHENFLLPNFLYEKLQATRPTTFKLNYTPKKYAQHHILVKRANYLLLVPPFLGVSW